ncbi:magnesium/cobalt transporter CorA [Oryzicola mucosus]|uniref:Magnesium transport protein CorA n=1 Tax=Oryzicola mucosus TaxID=2767425 RepID=A0A8J6PV20_9HYPH|nr:magnesium/cobalt transporter CorA [Oryzicola mucosus]MBD0414542.1 magnesium/cobalt transporter CorA [Oryzicola mucosus]
MIKAFVVESGRLRLVDDLDAHKADIAWADLHEPTREEVATIQNWLGIELPSRDEMEEIEISSRLYVEDGAYFMTATVPAKTEVDEDPIMAPVTFVLVGSRLVTMRYHDPRAFRIYPQRAEKADTGCTTGDTILIGLLEALVDRIADILERAARDIEALSREIFRTRDGKTRGGQDFQSLLTQIGRKEDLASNIRDSLTSLQRLSGFFAHAATTAKMNKDVRARIKTLSRDVLSIADHTTFLSQKVNFLLDATLGMINIEQNAIIKIFSVAAVIFLPPTLVASIYGMNFDVMPELNWEYGYPFGIGLMIVSAILPYLYFRRRGWL